MRGTAVLEVRVEKGLVRGEGAGLVRVVQAEELGEQQRAEAALDDLHHVLMSITASQERSAARTRRL